MVMDKATCTINRFKFEVCTARLCDVEAILADVVDSFIVNLKSHRQRCNHRHRKATERYMP